MGVLGLDPLRFLHTTDDFERGLMQELAKRMLKTKQLMDKNLAVEIANAVGKMLSG